MCYVLHIKERKLIIMMLIPRRNFDLWEDFFDDPFFNSSHNESKVMKTDIKEKENTFVLEMDLPGFSKEDIKIEVENGYLTVNAKMNKLDEDEEEGKFIRKERYYGECSRSFYIGEEISEDDIKASFRNGILKLEIPKQDLNKQIPEKKYIEIED